MNSKEKFFIVKIWLPTMQLDCIKSDCHPKFLNYAQFAEPQTSKKFLYLWGYT